MKQQQSTQAPEQAQADHRSLSNEQLKSQGAREISETHRSPLRLLIVTIVAIFIAEVVAMIVVYAFGTIPYYQTTTIDAGIMTILIFPVLYYLSFRPLIRQMEKSWQAENRLRRVNRTLFVLNECNQALVHAEKENQFLQRMCQILVTIGEYRMAWVGFAEHDESRSVRPVAQFGFENGYLDLAHITWADDERGQGPTGTAIRQGVVQVNQNFLTNPKMAPWRESAVSRSYQSSIALPLQNEKSTIGALTLYSVLPDAFDEEEVRLLKELSNDLAFGITALRVRSERNQAEELNRQLSRIVEQTEDTVVVTNCEGAIEYVNPAFERLTGYTKEETLGKTPRVLKSGFHNNHFYQELWNTILKGDVFQSEVANRKKNGELFYEVKTITPLRDSQGNITHFVATGKDITEHKQDEQKLQNAYVELELRVQERTEQLRVANAELEDEVRIRRQTEKALQKAHDELEIRVQERTAELNQMAEALSIERQRFKNALDHLPAYLILLTPDYRVSLANRFFEERFGKSEGRRCYEYLFSREEPCEICETYSVLKTNGPHRWEWTGPDGHNYDIYDFPFADVDGSPLIMEVGLDITERKQTEAELAKYRVHLEELVRERTARLEEVNRELQEEIAERKRAEEALLQSEERLSRAEEIAHLGSWELDLINDQLTWSDEVYQIFGLQPQEFPATYDAFLKVVHPDDRAAVDAAYSNSIREGKNGYEIEHRVTRRSSGEVRIVHEKCEHFRDESGQIIRSVGMVHDITERKLAEDQLRYQAALLSNVNDAIVASDAQFRLTAWNSAAEALYGWRAEEVIGRNGVEIMRTEWGERDPQEMRRRIAETGRWRGEVSQIRRDGTRFPVEVSSIVLRDDRGQVTGYISVNRDITERKQAEKRLAYLASFPEQNPNPVMEMDFSGRVYYANPAAEKILSDLPERGLAHPWLAGWDEIVSAFREGQPIHTSREVVLGERFYQQSFHVLDQDRLVRIYGTEITKRKQAEEALRESEAKYRNLFENMTEEVHFWHLVRDESGRIMTWRLVDANPPTLKSWNRKTVDEIRGKTTDEIFGPGSTDHYMPIVQKIMNEGVPYSYEDKFVQLDKYFRFTSVPLGEHFITTGADITQIKKSEDALRAARDELELRVQERTRELANANRDLLNEIAERKEVERQLRIQTTAMEAAGSGIVITDRHGTIQWTNPAMTLMSGYEARDLIGQSMRVFSSRQHDADFYRQLWDTILSGQVWRGETINQRKDGITYTEDQTITPVQGDHGVITHFIAIKQDITERKQAEIELERRNAELQIISVAERKQRQFSEALVSAALILNKSLKLDEVLTLILEQIKEVIPYQLADIALLDGDFFYDASHQEGDLPWPASLTGVNNRARLEDFPLLKQMRQTGEPILVLDSEKEPDWKMVDALAWTRSLLAVPLLAETKVIGFVNLFSDRPGFFTKEMSNRLVAFAVHAAVAIQNAWLFEQVRASTERLHSLSRRLVEIQENERLYISRELHDEAGQILTSLIVDLRLLEKNASDPTALLKITAEMERSLNAVSENLHRVAMALRPASLDHVGLVAALRQYAESLSERNGLPVSFRAGERVERLPSNVETVLYRIIQEALTNVIRHAHATRADVVLTVRDGKLIVIIEDDGVGFDPDVVNKGERLGLFGMRERAEMIGGKLTIESAPGKGTTVVMEVNYADTVIGRR